MRAAARVPVAEAGSAVVLQWWRMMSSTCRQYSGWLTYANLARRGAAQHGRDTGARGEARKGKDGQGKAQQRNARRAVLGWLWLGGGAGTLPPPPGIASTTCLKMTASHQRASWLGLEQRAPVAATPTEDQARGRTCHYRAPPQEGSKPPRAAAEVTNDPPVRRTDLPLADLPSPHAPPSCTCMYVHMLLGLPPPPAPVVLPPRLPTYA